MANISTFLVYVAVTTFTPGPNNIVSMINGIQFSYTRILKFLAGLLAGFFLVMLAGGFLNIFLTNLLPSAEHWLKIIGVIYMLYLAYHIARSKGMDDPDQGNSMNTFKFGFFMQFLNLKGILYGITVFSLFITHTYRDPLSIIIFSLLLTFVAFLATSLWAIGGNIFQNFLRKHYRIFNYLMAALLVYTAIASLLKK